MAYRICLVVALLLFCSEWRLDRVVNAASTATVPPTAAASTQDPVSTAANNNVTASANETETVAPTEANNATVTNKTEEARRNGPALAPF